MYGCEKQHFSLNIILFYIVLKIVSSNQNISTTKLKTHLVEGIYI